MTDVIGDVDEVSLLVKQFLERLGLVPIVNSLTLNHVVVGITT